MSTTLGDTRRIKAQARAVAARRPATLAALLVILLLLAGRAIRKHSTPAAEAGVTPTVPAPSATLPAHPNVVAIDVEHTIFHPMENVALNVERMKGRMVAAPGQTISLDDPNSFSVHIDQAVTRLSAQDLSALINSYLLKQADSAVRHLDVSFDGQQVLLKGKVHKLLTLPFSARGVLSATPQGELRMHLEEFRVAGVLNRSFLSFFGIRLDTMAQPHHKASFRVEGNDFVTSLNELFPPPLVYGKLTRVHIEGQSLVQVIGVQPPEHAIAQIPKALPEPPNYIYFTGGRMRFGRMTMDNVDLKMVDQAPQDAFDFSLIHYQQQIQAGYVKVLPSQAVVVYARDWSSLSKTRPR